MVCCLIINLNLYSSHNFIYIISFCSSANATPEFEGKGGDDLANEISNILSLSYYNPSVFNLRKLCILPYRKCWKMFVDILVRAICIYIKKI